jgi:hemolysin activation/secretion protein
MAAGWAGLCLHGAVRADPAPVPGRDARTLLRDNNERLREEIDTLRLRQLQRGSALTPSPEQAASDPGNECLPVKAVRVEGVTLLSRNELATVPVPRRSCFSRAELQRLLHDLHALYLARGFIEARVLPEAPHDGVLTLRVIEGRLEKIAGAPGAATWLFPGLIGQAVNIRDLEQGLDQANRLQSERMRAEILPGEQLGGSNLFLTDAALSPWHGAVSLTNAGYDSTGRTDAALSLGRDNLTGRYDYLNLALERSQGPARHSVRGSMFYSIPLGYWTGSAFYSQSTYLNTQPLVFNTVELSGEAMQSGVRIDRVLSRGQTRIDSAYAQLAHKRVRNYFMGSQQDISSPSLTVLEAGLDRLVYFANGVWSLEMAVAQGVPWLGADRDTDSPYPDPPHAQFTKARLSASWQQGGHSFVLDSRFVWQGCRQALPAIEQIELADNSMVRGFRHNGLSGETGWASHNTLSRPVALRGWLASPRLGLDVGRVLMRASSQNYQSLAGGGVGLALSREGMTLDVEYSRPLYQPDGFAGEAHQVLARLSWQF